MVQEIIVGILFIAAVIYLIGIFRKQTRAKTTCGSAVCKCDTKSQVTSSVAKKS